MPFFQTKKAKLGLWPKHGITLEAASESGENVPSKKKKKRRKRSLEGASPGDQSFAGNPPAEGKGVLKKGLNRR